MVIGRMLLVIGLLAGLAVPALAESEDGSADEAVTMTRKAIALIQAEGTDKAYTAFRDLKGPFVMKDLYVFCMDMNGIMLVHGRNPGLIGKDLTKLKDTDSKLFIQEMITVAKTGSGWVDYKWTNPDTKKIEPKRTYAEKVDGNSFCAVGIYKR